MNRRVLVAAIFLITSLPTAPAFAGVTPISKCGTVITEPGKYKVVRDLLLCPDAALFGPPLGVITIASSGVDLNLKGHTITCDYVDDQFPGPDASIGAGILVQPFYSDIRIRNGSISNCNDGIVLIENSNVKVSNIRATDNRTEFDPFSFGRGVAVFGGSNNTIRGNSTLRNDRQGIAISGEGSVVRNNIVNENGGTGLEGFFQSNTEYLCNTANQNANAGIALTGGGDGNILRGNVTNGNGLSGIVMFGRSDLDPGVQPIPEGTIIKKNISLGNGFDDLAEILFDLSTGTAFVEDGAPCRNDWSDNEFVNEFGPEMCIGAPVLLDNDDVCALDDDDD